MFAIRGPRCASAGLVALGAVAASTAAAAARRAGSGGAVGASFDASAPHNAGAATSGSVFAMAVEAATFNNAVLSLCVAIVAAAVIDSVVASIRAQKKNNNNDNACAVDVIGDTDTGRQMPTATTPARTPSPASVDSTAAIASLAAAVASSSCACAVPTQGGASSAPASSPLSSTAPAHDAADPPNGAFSCDESMPVGQAARLSGVSPLHEQTNAAATGATASRLTHRDQSPLMMDTAAGQPTLARSSSVQSDWDVVSDDNRSPLGMA